MSSSSDLLKPPTICVSPTLTMFTLFITAGILHIHKEPSKSLTVLPVGSHNVTITHVQVKTLHYLDPDGMARDYIGEWWDTLSWRLLGVNFSSWLQNYSINVRIGGTPNNVMQSYCHNVHVWSLSRVRNGALVYLVHCIYVPIIQNGSASLVFPCTILCVKWQAQILWRPF